MSINPPKIIGKHILTNVSFELAVLEVALEQLCYLEKDEYSALTLSGLVVKQLSLPPGEKMLVLNIIAPRTTTVSKKFLEESLLALHESASNTTNEVTPPEPITAKTISPSQIKADIFEIVKSFKIVPETYLEAEFGKELKKMGLTIPSLLKSFAMNELAYIDHFVAINGYQASQHQLHQLLLAENGHRPFNANILAKRYALPLDETLSRLKKRKFGDLILWNSYQAWSIADINVTDDAKKKIRDNVARAGDNPLLLRDIFHIVMVGIIAENSYDDIELSARKECAFRGLHEAGIFGYEFNANEKKFYLAARSQNNNKKPLYKVFGRKN